MVSFIHDECFGQFDLTLTTRPTQTILVEMRNLLTISQANRLIEHDHSIIPDIRVFPFKFNALHIMSTERSQILFGSEF